MNRALSFFLRAFGCAGILTLAGCDEPLSPVEFEIICTCQPRRPRPAITVEPRAVEDSLIYGTRHP